MRHLFGCAYILTAFCAWYHVYARGVGRRAFLAPSLDCRIPNRISSPLAWNGHLEGRTSPPLLFRKVTKCSLPLRSVGSDVADNKEPFAGCSELLHNSSIWSDNALDLSFEDMAAREVDIHNYESRSLGQVRRLGAVVASALIVGAIYGTLTIIRSFLNQQQAKLRADRYGSSGVYSETSTDTETFR